MHLPTLSTNLYLARDLRGRKDVLGSKHASDAAVCRGLFWIKVVQDELFQQTKDAFLGGLRPGFVRCCESNDRVGRSCGSIGRAFFAPSMDLGSSERGPAHGHGRSTI